MKQHIVLLDPYNEIDAGIVDTEITELQKQEIYSFDQHQHFFGQIHENQFAKVTENRYARMDANKIAAANNKRLGNLKDFISYCENKKSEFGDKYHQAVHKSEKAMDRQEKLKFNFEVVVYLKQGQVEVPQLPVATDYKDAILINLNDIKFENGEIKLRGNKKVRNMEEILNSKTELKQVKTQVKRFTLLIEDLVERTKDVQLYRVTKQT